MVGSIREILNIETMGELRQAFPVLEADIDRAIVDLDIMLEKNVQSSDVTSMIQHMSYIESWRSRVVKYLYLTTGFVEYSKSSRFALPVHKGTTEAVRDAHKKTLSGPFSAMQTRLELLIECIDSRVNLCKKTLGMEVDGHNLTSSRFRAA